MDSTTRRLLLAFGLFLIVALGAIRPTGWWLFIIGSAVAVVIATALTLYIPRLYPWGEGKRA